LQQFPIIKYIT